MLEKTFWRLSKALHVKLDWTLIQSCKQSKGESIEECWCNSQEGPLVAPDVLNLNLTKFFHEIIHHS